MVSSLSVGAVGAAFIAAVISLLGLIIAKEQKISDFRQTWIDSLRLEITNYLTNINSISDALNVTYSNHSEKVKALSQLYSALNNAHYMITLRLNPDEKFASDVLNCMKEFTELADDEDEFKSIQVRKEIEGKFLLYSKNLLKNEWKRVKRGEPAFMIAKYATFLVLVSLIIYPTFLYISYDSNDHACWVCDIWKTFMAHFPIQS